MGESHSEMDRKALIDRLLRQAHEQSRKSAERSPFWREGEWRCEFYKQPGDARLKVFSGEQCVHEERVQNHAAADRRSKELRRVVVQSRRAGQENCLLR
ncbi:MAG: hypothetical protein ACRD1U_11430 [Vicinamibacterales bacterium]